MDDTRKIFTLTQLNSALERHFLNEFGPKNYWITAELAHMNNKSGSLYFELVDAINGVKSAQMTAHMWSTQVLAVRQKIGEDFNVIVKPGNKVLMCVKIEFHKIYGLKLNVTDIDSSYSYGEIEREKSATIERLRQEGVFALQKSLHLPVFAKRIALVGSPQTSGFRDFCDTLFSNNAYRNFKLKYFPSSVQGETAVRELVEAIESAQEYDVDVIVIVRGGGSKMDLHVFNHYEVCKAICESKIPVVTGIGHESDEVVSDMVAFQKTITPTACAKFLYMRIFSFSKDLNESYLDLKSAAFFQMTSAMEMFQHQNNYLVLHARELLNNAKEKLQHQTHSVQSSFMRMLTTEKMEIEMQLDRVEGYAVQSVKRAHDMELVSRLERVEWLAKAKIETSGYELKNLQEVVALLNPEKLFRAGYTISTIDHVDVMNYQGDFVSSEMITLAHGLLLTSTINNVKKISEDGTTTDL